MVARRTKTASAYIAKYFTWSVQPYISQPDDPLARNFVATLSRDYPLFAKVALEVWNQFQLLLHCKIANDDLKYRTNSNMVYPDEAAVIYISKHTHKEPIMSVRSRFIARQGKSLTDNPSDQSSHRGQGYCDQNP